MRLGPALFTIAWLACLAPAAAAPVAGDAQAAVQRAAARQIPRFPLRDDAAMVLVGTALIGLGAAVRRAT